MVFTSVLRLGAYGFAAFLAIGSASAARGSVIYLEDFNSYPPGDTPVTNFSEVPNTTTYTIVQKSTNPTVDNGYRADLTAASSASAGVNLNSTLAGGLPNSFSISTDVTFRSVSATSANFGLGLFGSAANFAAGGSGFSSGTSEYRLLYNSAGSVNKLTLTKGSATVTNGTSTGSLTVTPDHAYTITADIAFSGTTLNINNATVTDITPGSTFGNSTSIANYTDTNRLTGTMFGYRTATAATAPSPGTETVEYDNFTVSVPEPSSAAVAMLGFSTLGLFRRRRARVIGV